MTTPPAPPTTTRTGTTTAGRALLVAYATAGVLTVASDALAVPWLGWATKPLLMPLLLGWLIVVATRPLVPPLRAMAVGLVFAWLGDVALMAEGDLAFLLGIASFLVMQLCYIAAFRRVPGPGLVRAWPIALVPYVLVWIGFAVAMRAEAGVLYLPACLYGMVLVGMAVAALDLVLRVPRRPGWRVAGGAIVFVVSDGLIALTAFAGVPDTRATAVGVMATYVVAQAMIVTGFVAAVGARADAAVPGTASRP